MSDHIEAMAREIAEHFEAFCDDAPVWPSEVTNREVAADVWAAGIEALIAHQPCGGTGCENDPDARLEAVEDPCCDGPHTVIDKGDGTKLYANPALLIEAFVDQWTAYIPLPSEWRIE